MRETVVQPSGRLETGAVPAFEHELASACLLGSEHVLVDLSRVDFLGSMAIRALLSAARRLSPSGGRMVILADGEIANMFYYAQLDAVIPVHSTLAAAQAALRQAGR